MSKLICDICGTSYSDSVDKCPTCGYSRAFEELAAEEAQVPVVREKVRGGRFSKKNVRKRMKLLAESGQKTEEPVSLPDLEEELRAVPALLLEQEPEPAQACAEEPEAEEIPVEIPAEENELEVPVVIPVEPIPEAEVPLEIFEQPCQVKESDLICEEASAADTDPELAEERSIEEELAAVFQTPDPAEEPEEEAEDAPIVVPVVMPEEEAPEEAPKEPAEEEEKEKKKGGLLLNVVLVISLAAFLAAAVYLVVNYAIPYLKEMEWPTQTVVETTEPTEEPTEAPTDAPTEAPTDPPTDPPTEAPTEAPTDPPTEAPTEAPTDPPTEAPTEPLLDVKLELNYYDLTFGAANQATQLKAVEIPNEDITWISDDPAIAVVSETGLISPVSGGRTTIRAIYGDQEVTVKVHCAF